MTEISRFGHDFSQIPVHASVSTPTQPAIHQAGQDPNPTERQPAPPAQQHGSCELPARVNEVIDPTDPSTVPSPRPSGRHPVGITHLFVRGRSVKEVELTSGLDAVTDLLFPPIGTSWSLEWEGKRCHLTKPRPASTDPGTYSRVSILTSGPWRRTVAINELNDISGGTPRRCRGISGQTTLVIGGHPSVAAFRRAVRAEEMEHAADQERLVCTHLRAYETAVRALPTNFLTSHITDCEEAAERRTGRSRTDRLSDFISQMIADVARRHAGGRHTHRLTNWNISPGCRQIEYDINASSPRTGSGLILPP